MKQTLQENVLMEEEHQTSFIQEKPQKSSSSEKISPTTASLSSSANIQNNINIEKSINNNKDIDFSNEIDEIPTLKEKLIEEVFFF